MSKVTSNKAGAVLFQCDEKQLRNISKKYEDMLGNYHDLKHGSRSHRLIA